MKKVVNGATEDYWGRPHPLSPRASVDGEGEGEVRREKVKGGKEGLGRKIKKALDRGTEEYWGNAEMNAVYFGVVKN